MFYSEVQIKFLRSNLKNYLKLNLPPETLSTNEVLDLTGAFPGSCGPVGLSCPIFIDNGLQSLSNYIVGANKDGFHLKNVSPTRDFKVTAFGDFRFAVAGDQCPQCLGFYKQLRGIEVGHIFYLGQKYSKAMKATYLDASGKEQVIEMGCYGLGVSRTLQATVEQNHDKDGILWPLSITPYHVHICHLDRDYDIANQVVEKLEKDLEQKGVEVFVDDRDERPGVKFKDADLLGFPFRVVVGQRNLSATEKDISQQKVELVKRANTAQRQLLTVQSIIEIITEQIKSSL